MFHGLRYNRVTFSFEINRNLTVQYINSRVISIVKENIFKSYLNEFNELCATSDDTHPALSVSVVWLSLNGRCSLE